MVRGKRGVLGCARVVRGAMLVFKQGDRPLELVEIQAWTMGLIWSLSYWKLTNA